MRSKTFQWKWRRILVLQNSKKKNPQKQYNTNDFDIHFVSFMQHPSYETQTYLTACCLVHHVCCRITAAWPPATHVA